MYGSDSCLERCRALNKLHRNFLVFIFLTKGHNILYYPHSLKTAQARLPEGSHRICDILSLSQLYPFPSLWALKLLCPYFYTPFWMKNIDGMVSLQAVKTSF